jgi:adenylyltransferase/sulfurtransferase
LGREAGFDRYDRQMRIPGWGEPGQRKLAQASVLVAGVGGLGSLAASLLVAGGVGSVRVVDRDLVELSNLNRQLLHWERDLGASKAASAWEKLSAMNSGIKVQGVASEIDGPSLGEILRGIDGIVDGLDNFETRYLLNRAAVERGIPFFHGSVYGLEGRVTTVLPGRSPCLRCLYESAPKPGVFPVLGSIPSIVGSIQALEAMKYFVGLGQLLVGRLLVIDGEDMAFSEIEISRNPNCPDCGEAPSTA